MIDGVTEGTRAKEGDLFKKQKKECASRRDHVCAVVKSLEKSPTGLIVFKQMQCKGVYEDTDSDKSDLHIIVK